MHFLAAALISGTAGISQAVEKIRLYDVESFEIAGVRLRMTLKEARSAMSKFYSVPESKIRLIESSAATPPWAQLIFDAMPGTSLKVSLAADTIKPSSDNYRVHTIWLSGSKTAQDNVNLLQQLVARFGTPSIKTGEPENNNLLAKWCSKPSEFYQGKDCDTVHAAFMNDNNGFVTLQNEEISKEQTARYNKSSSTPLKF